MMDRNTTIGLILIGLLLTVFTLVNQPSKEDIEKAKKEQAAKKKKEHRNEDKKSNHKDVVKYNANIGNDTPIPQASQTPVKKSRFSNLRK